MHPLEVESTRVVVTGEVTGRSRVVSDRVVDEPRRQADRPVAYSDVWYASLAGLAVDDDGRWPEPYAIAPAIGALNLRVTQFGPMSLEEIRAFAGRNPFDSAGSGGDFVPGAASPFMHRTETVDIGIVLEGRITMVLDDGETELGPGDVVVQRGTAHAWENRGDAIALVAFLMVGATR